MCGGIWSGICYLSHTSPNSTVIMDDGPVVLPHIQLLDVQNLRFLNDRIDLGHLVC